MIGLIVVERNAVLEWHMVGVDDGAIQDALDTTWLPGTDWEPAERAHWTERGRGMVWNASTDPTCGTVLLPSNTSSVTRRVRVVWRGASGGVKAPIVGAEWPPPNVTATARAFANVGWLIGTAQPKESIIDQAGKALDRETKALGIAIGIAIVGGAVALALYERLKRS